MRNILTVIFIFSLSNAYSQVLNKEYSDNMLMFKISSIYYENVRDERRYSDKLRLLEVYSKDDPATGLRYFYVTNTDVAPPFLPDEYYDLKNIPVYDIHLALKLGQIFILHFKVDNFDFKRDTLLQNIYFSQEFYKHFDVLIPFGHVVEYKVMLFTVDDEGKIYTRVYPEELDVIAYLMSLIHLNPDRRNFYSSFSP